MPATEVLILAMTKMLSGVCTAGMTAESHPLSGLRWVRPVRRYDTLLLGDVTCADGGLFCCCDVVALDLISPRPDPPHVEDWEVDFVRSRPRRLRRLEGERRAQFLAAHLDRAPEDVIVAHTRSLCLVQPERVHAHFALDQYSGKYEARMSLALPGGIDHPQAAGQRGIPVTDLKWRALGRSWLQTEGSGRLTLEQEALFERLGADGLYLTLGLSRSWRGTCWLLAVGVHVVPDFEATVDPRCL